MTQAFFTSNQSSPDILIQAIFKENQAWEGATAEAKAEYDVKGHKVFDKGKRPMRKVTKPGNVLGADGQPVLITVFEEVNRVGLPWQKLVVSRNAAFLTGGEVALTANPEDATQDAMLKAIRKAWRDNKIQYRNGEIAKAIMMQLQCAEVWYTVQDDAGKTELRSRLFKPWDGFRLLPVWDEFGGLQAFAIGWKDAGDNTSNLLLYTKNWFRKYQQQDHGWAQVQEEKLSFGKMPVIYFSQPAPEWEDVQGLIDRLEQLSSNFADTNDYNGSPILVAVGKIKSFASKGESGKIVELDDSPNKQADLKYLTWEHAPESIRMEMEYLLRYIHTILQMPDLSFDAMKGLGDISGVAFDRVMIDAHLKAADRANGDFGESIQRRINFLIAACAWLEKSLAPAVGMEITAKFSLFRIDSEADRVELAMKANGNKPVASHKASVAMAGLTEDPDAEYEAIQAQQKEAMKNQLPLASTDQHKEEKK